jgi:hypothetical protein
VEKDKLNIASRGDSLPSPKAIDHEEKDHKEGEDRQSQESPILIEWQRTTQVILPSISIFYSTLTYQPITLLQ